MSDPGAQREDEMSDDARALLAEWEAQSILHWCRTGEDKLIAKIEAYAARKIAEARRAERERLISELRNGLRGNMGDAHDNRAAWLDFAADWIRARDDAN